MAAKGKKAFILHVECAEDCGNAPKKKLLKHIHIDYWRNGGRLLTDHLADEAVWQIAAGARVEGKEAIAKHLAADGHHVPKALIIHHIITHGNVASLNASVSMEHGRRMEYCDVYEFAGFGRNAKIKMVTSYRLYSREGV